MNYRKELKIDENTDLKFSTENGNIVIKKIEDICRICDVEKCLNDLPVCEICADRIKNKL
ncbi:MAG: hypothetical protein IJW03_00125 [Clostridia bacterium]|nr:hypothetical protein [Clostridia bacterium]